MKLISTTIALFITFLQSNGQNMTTTDMMMTTNMDTTMYTTMDNETLDCTADLMPETDPSMTCIAESMVTFIEDDNFYVSVCIYEESTDVYMTNIEISGPADSWLAVGFSTPGTYEAGGAGARMQGYSIIIPLCDSGVVTELFLNGIPGSNETDPEWLVPSVTVYYDVIENDVRTVKLTRPVTVDGEYYDFAELMMCNNSADMIYAMGMIDTPLPSYHGPAPNRGATTLTIDGGEACEMDMSTTDVIALDCTANTMPDVDPSNNEDAPCAADATVTLVEGENFYVSVCIYGETEDDLMASIEVKGPSDKWFAVGFQTPGDYEDGARMQGYSVIIPLCDSGSVQELFLNGPPQGTPWDELTSSIEVYYDVIAGDIRTIKLSRPLKVGIADIGQGDDGTNLAAVNGGKYFDFTALTMCDDEVDVIYAMGESSDVPFPSYHGIAPNRGVKTLAIEAMDGDECKISLDSANQYVLIFTIIIPIIAMLF